MEPDETLGLVILSSDKTHLTVGQGDKECHAVYMTCGNIKKALRTKVGAHCWMMIAQVPIAKFEPSRHQGLLTNRLLHSTASHIRLFILKTRVHWNRISLYGILGSSLLVTLALTQPHLPQTVFPAQFVS